MKKKCIRGTYVLLFLAPKKKDNDRYKIDIKKKKTLSKNLLDAKDFRSNNDRKIEMNMCSCGLNCTLGEKNCH